MKLLAALLIATLSLAIAACGTSSSTTTTSSAAQGQQAGEVFVCIYRQTTKTAPTLVQDYQMWVSGEVTVANHVDGGAVFSIQLPMISVESEQEHPHPSNR